MSQGLKTGFQFYSSALKSPTFSVESFSGEESLAKSYRFEIYLLAAQPDIELENLLESTASLRITQQGKTRTIHGVISEIDLDDELPGGLYRYRAVLVPRLWLLSLMQQNQVYQEKNIPDILREVLLSCPKVSGPQNYASQAYAAGITDDYFEFRFAEKASYPMREYVVQYNENNLNFLSRLMEHEGIFYFFEQRETSEKLIITDHNAGCSTFVAMQNGCSSVNNSADIVYHSKANRQVSSPLAIHKFSSKRKQAPQQVVLNDYNYRLPHITLEATGIVSDKGVGQITTYGDHYKTPEQGRRYAQLRAEKINCAQHRYAADSQIHTLHAGCHFNLQAHFLKPLNRAYLINEIRHTGKTNTVSGSKAQASYHNSFICQAADVPYRPALVTPKPKLYGIMNATIDAAGDGQRAEIDEQGRYKVQLPFDVSGNGEGKASRYIRMATPYGGNKQGMHFPLLKGTEVIWTCIDGDLDRPIIVGTVPNPLNKSVVTDENSTANVIKTSGGIHMEFNDGLVPIARHEVVHNTATQQALNPDHCKQYLSSNTSDAYSLVAQQHLSIARTVTISTPSSVKEGQPISFPVTLSEAASADTTLSFNVSGNGAASTAAVSAIVSAGSRTTSISIPTLSDTNVDNATVSLVLDTVSDTTYSGSIGVAAATGIVKDTNVGISSNESSGQKRFKLKVPEWNDNNGTVQSSYLRVGNADSTELMETRSDIDLGLNSTADAGVFDYTDGNRTEITDGDREIYVNGKHRMTINSGGLGLFDAEPIYSLWFDELPAGWHKIETGFSSSTAATFGSSESLWFGSTFSGSAGLDTSVSLAGSVSGNLVGSVGFDVGFKVSGNTGYSVSYSVAGSIEKVEKKKTIDAGESITLTVGGNDNAAKVAYGTAMTAVIGGVGGQFATTMAQAIGAKVQENQWKPAEAAACQGIGITASALAWVAAMKMGVGIVTGEKIRKRLASKKHPAINITDNEISLQCGDSCLRLTADGTVEIEAKSLEFTGEEKIDLSGEVYVYDGDLTIQDKNMWISKGDAVIRKGDIDVDTGTLNTSNGNSY